MAELSQALRILPPPPPSRKPRVRNEADPREFQPDRRLKLNQAKPGCWVMFQAFRLDPVTRDHLYEQGLRETLRARILHNDYQGRIFLRLLNGELFVLGRLETPHIEVMSLRESRG